jgi:hypothetical protein
VYVNIVLWALGNLYVFLLARRWLPPREAVVAALLAGTMPLSLALARSFFVEAAVTTAVVAFVFHAEASERLTRPRHVVALALWCAVGLLAKIAFPAYVVVPALLSTLARPGGAPLRRGRILLTWALVTVAGSAVAWWIWYGRNWNTVLRFAGSSSFGALSAQYSRDSLGDYVMQLARHGASLWVLSVLVVLLGAWLLGRARVDLRRTLWCGLWIGPPLMAMLMADNGEIRYVAPLLPGLALIIATLLHGALGAGEARRVVAAVVVLGPVLLHMGLWSTGLLPKLGADRWVTHGFWYGRYEGPPYQDAWPQQEIVRAIAAPRGGGERPPTIAVNINSPEMNHDNLTLMALLMRFPLRTLEIPADAPAAFGTAFSAEYIVSLVRGEPPRNGLNDNVASLNEALWSGELPFVLTRTFDVPGGWKLGLFRHHCPSSEGSDRSEPLAMFEGGLALLDVRMSSLRCQSRIQVEWSAAKDLLPRAVLLVEVRDGSGRPRTWFMPRGCAADPAMTSRGRARLEFLVDPGLLDGGDLQFAAVDAWTGRALPILLNASRFERDLSRTRLIARGPTVLNVSRGDHDCRAP